jgi:hypothetical protein
MSVTHSFRGLPESLSPSLAHAVGRCCEYWSESIIQALVSGDRNPLQRFHTVPMSHYQHFRSNGDGASNAKLNQNCPPSDLFSTLYLYLSEQLIQRVTLHHLKSTLRESIQNTVLAPHSPFISISYQFQSPDSSAYVTHNLVPLGNQIIRLVTQEKFLISLEELMTMLTDCEYSASLDALTSQSCCRHVTISPRCRW